MAKKTKTKMDRMTPEESQELSRKLSEHFGSQPNRMATIEMEPNLSHRDLFAMAALQGDWASQSNESGYFENTEEPTILEDRARLYYLMADAMLKVRGE